MKRLPALLLTLLVLVATAAPALAAADPDEVAAAVRDTGVYVQAGSDLSAAEAGRLVAEARNAGERLSVIVLTEDPPSGAVTFGDAVADRLDGGNLLFVLTPSDVGIAGEGVEFTTTEIQHALDVADAAGGSDSAYVTNFVNALVATGAATTGGGTSGSSGGSGLVWFLVIVAVIGLGIVLLVWWSRRKTGATAAAKLAAAKEEVQKQVDAVANDILDMADEVRVSGNDQAETFFEQASATYSAASDRLAAAATPQALLDLSNELDVAIWQLDCAEALLDGKEPPPKPEPRTPEPAPTPTQPAATPPTATAPTPAPGYRRRSTRRSSYAGPGVLDVLIGVAGQVMAGGRVRSRGGLLGGGMFGGGASRTARRSSSRSSGASRSRGTGGRIRMGRSRRR
jgi:hypothetical protein